jgi:adenine-specific DNA-methyltransferase
MTAHQVICGDAFSLLRDVADTSVQLVVTSPPYNLGKGRGDREDFGLYVRHQHDVIDQCCRIVKLGGSIAWQVGNTMERGRIVPLDLVVHPFFVQNGFILRNRIVWHFEHGLHCSKRFSGRYEVVLWYSKGDDYTFNLDPVRVPQKYPGKRHYKGPDKGKLSGNPKGKNPGDVWGIPNVKHNHCEKTDHPCQFPVELAERLILSLSNPRDLVVDPYLGSGSTAIAAVRHHRDVLGFDLDPHYCDIARDRIFRENCGTLVTRPMGLRVLRSGGHAQ